MRVLHLFNGFPLSLEEASFVQPGTFSAGRQITGLSSRAALRQWTPHHRQDDRHSGEKRTDSRKYDTDFDNLVLDD